MTGLAQTAMKRLASALASALTSLLLEGAALAQERGFLNVPAKPIQRMIPHTVALA